jgi:uroporphyrinogen decarboxylase
MSMDTYLRFAVENLDDWRSVSKRFDPASPERREDDWQRHAERWRARDIPLIFAPNCQTMGFYWMAREMMGTEGLSFAWYDQPRLMHEMMTFWGDFLIEAARPVLEVTDLEYITLNEDMAMKNGPLLGPDTYRTFIFPHMKRVVEFYKSHGVRYVLVDTDGNPEPLVPLLMEAGVDMLWPLERAADQDPVRLRKKFGKSLRLSGGVDKRELAKGPEAIDAHLKELQPLVAEGGFIPTVDHAVSPDISWDSFRYYMDAKRKLLAGTL